MRNTKVPEGWDVRPPCPGDESEYWRIVAAPGTPHACVVDGRPTEKAAISRCHEIIANRKRVYENYLRREGLIR